MQTADNPNQLLVRNILYATDLSFAAGRALPFVREITQRHGSMLYVVQVVSLQAEASRTDSYDAAEKEESVRQNGERFVQEELKGIFYEIVFLSGRIWQKLSDFINEKQIDLLVFTTRVGENGRETSLGSIADEILHKAQCPLLVVGPGVLKQSENGTKLERILFATDFTTASLAAVPHVISFAQRHQAQAILLHVISNGEDAPAMLYALRHLIPLGTELPYLTECTVEYGETASKILEVAEQKGADLIILGARAKGGVRSLFADSIMFRIFTSAKCPVLATRL